MEKKIFFLLLVLIINISIAHTQGLRPGLMPNIQGLKIAYFTRELSLSQEEAQKFWPVYYDYTDEVAAVRNEQKNDVISSDEKVLSVKKKYYGQFRSVLGNNGQRAGKVYLCEREFGNYIKKEIENRQRMRAMRLPKYR